MRKLHRKVKKDGHIKDTFPSAARADNAIFKPNRRTFLFSLMAWLRGFGPCIVAPPLNCCQFKQTHKHPIRVTSKSIEYLLEAPKKCAVHTWGPRNVPCLARPVPFCFHGFRPVPLTSLIVFVEWVPWGKTNSFKQII